MLHAVHPAPAVANGVKAEGIKCKQKRCLDILTYLTSYANRKSRKLPGGSDRLAGN
jgi:hypothetical protein